MLLCDRAPALAARKAGRRGLLPQRQMELGQRIGGGAILDGARQWVVG